MYNLEKSIKKWRKKMVKIQAFEDGYIKEIESHLRDEIESLIQGGNIEEEAFKKAVKKIGSPESIGREFYKTYSRNKSSVPPWEAKRFSLALLSNYLKMAIRKMKRQKGYSFINIVGLAIGIVCCLFIMMYVFFHLSFDAYHQDADRLFVVGQDRTSETGHELVGGNMPLLAPTLKERFPQVEYAARYNQGWVTQVTYKDKVFKEQGLWHADSDIFNVFFIPFFEGDPLTALSRPKTAVLTKKIANKYFGEINPLGKTIKIGDMDFEVTGIVADAPGNTEFKYKIIMSWKTIEGDEHWQGWDPGMAATGCIIKLRKNVDPMEFEELTAMLPHEYCGEELEKKGLVYRNFLHSIKDAHLYSISGETIKPSAVLSNIYIFSIVGFLILLIACMNFMNLTTARSSGRAGEVGMRKVVGARRRQIVWQFLGEASLLTLISIIVAVILVQLTLPIFNGLAATDFTAATILKPEIFLGMAVLLVLISFAAGGYPAIVFSSFKPISVLRGRIRAGIKSAVLRKVLVVGQFAISITLIIITMVVYGQIVHMKNQSLGFDKNQKLVVTLRTWEMITDKYEMIKEEFLSHSSVLNASSSSGVPGSMINRTWIFPFEEEATRGQAFRSLRCDHDFFEVYDIPMKAGRSFDKKIKTDTYEAIIINEAGVKAFGWASPEEALGKELWERRYPIIGVVKDFHWWGLQRDIEPLLARVVPDLFRSITLSVRTENLPETISFLKNKYIELFPGDVFEYFFVDSNFDLQYRSEERMGRLFRIFTILGVFIACLGLFGMASFVAERRTKEIGIRKVLGASVPGVVFLLSREFIKWVLFANIIAWPLAYYASSQWLQNFAFRMKISPFVFIGAALSALFIALLTVSYQSFKAATANPIESLRYE